MSVMRFDTFSVGLLILNDSRPSLSEQESQELQDSHMSHLADLHAAGHLLAAGPLEDASLRGLLIFKVGVEVARQLLEEDPAVRAGRFNVTVVSWMVPEGAMSFSATRFPRSIAEIG